MNKNEFEYNYYFELYKDESVIGHSHFKKIFKKKHPNVCIDLGRLVVEIEKYQINKYGHTKDSDFYIIPVNREREKKNARQNIRTRLGTSKERRERKMNKYKDD